MSGIFRNCSSSRILRPEEPTYLMLFGQDMTTNTGRKQRSLDARERLKFVVDAFDSMPRADYISTLAHDRQKFDQ